MSRRVPSAPPLVVAFGLAVVTALGMLVAAPAVDLAAAATSADVTVDAVPLGDSTTYPDVVAGGDGVFHAVVRDSSLGTRIVYLRSADAGRSWVRYAILSGTITATRPAIAADGDHLAVAFVGEWTDENGVSGEAPYLTTSDDAGGSWTPARRLGTWATDVDVAVDGDRVWVAWGGSGGIRGTADGGSSFFVSQNISGVARAQVAAGDGVVSAAYLDGAGDTFVAVGQGEQLGSFKKTEHAVLQDVAAADGLAYALVADGPDLSVLASAPGGSPARAHVPAPAGDSLSGGVYTSLWADLAAGRGTIAVATCVSGTVYVSESTDWPNFGHAVAATTFDAAAGEPCRATITAPSAGAELEPRFDWSVAPHYTDTDGDGLPEAANVTGSAFDEGTVSGNTLLQVTLNACASLPAAGGVPIARYIWSVNGLQVADLDHCAGPTILAVSGDQPKIRLEIRDDAGGRATTSRAIAPRDLVVVSLGDSVASGEGSPLRDRSGLTSAVWSDDSCHRSPYAGPALAARELEDEDPHTAVTFIQLACSGAAIVDTFDDPAYRKSATDPDDPKTGGVKDAYAGVVPADDCDAGGPCSTLRPSQLTQMERLLGSRSADAVLVSIGANDVRFSSTLTACLNPLVQCNEGAAAAEHDARMTELPARYQQLANGLDAAGVAPSKVHITEYFDPTGDEHGVAQLRCIAQVDAVNSWNGIVLGLVWDQEAIWARDHLVAGLDSAVAAAASDHGWDLVGGITSQFAQHGYCSDDPWVVRVTETFLRQGDKFGAFHPNKAGQEVYGDAIHAHLAALTQTAPTPVDQSPSTGAAAVGDLVVLASDVWAPHPELRSIALTTTGGAPTVGAVRVLQRGAGWGAVAVESSSSVGVWAGEHGGFGAQLGSRPNVAVRSVNIVQAPRDGSRLVTDRKTAVMADLWSSTDGSTRVDVTTSVVARDGGTETTVVAPVTESVLLYPGSNQVLLPTSEAFAAPEGSVLVATVKVADPPGAAEEDGADNELSTAPGDFVPTMASRPLRIAFVPLDFGGATVGCSDLATRANIWVAWAQQLLPVPDGGVLADLSCLPEQLAPSASETGIALALGELDLLAREAGLDSVVGVVPDHWLGNALGDGSVGRAGVTGRSILVEQSAPEATVAHELGHNLGLEHSEPDPVSGAWVSRNKVIRGTDFMSATEDGISRYWVGGDTWDLLTTSMSYGSAPTRPESGGTAYWVRGSMPIAGDTINLDPFIDDGDVPSPPPADSDTSRVTVVPIAADGSPAGPPVKVGLSDVEQSGGSGGSGGVAKTFAQRVVAPAGTVAFRILLDGAVVEERRLGSAPTVAVDAPTAGTTVPRSDKIHVAWTVTDPDTADGEAAPTVDLLVSDDGANWRPLASRLSGSSADLSVPRDLGGEHIRIRVVASDGVHLRWADSSAFEVVRDPVDASGARVAFVAGDKDQEHPSVPDLGTFPTWDRVGTMKPDGTDVTFFDAIPTMITVEPTRVTPVRWEHPASYSSPVWAPDGRIYFAEKSGSVSSIAPDGSGLRTEIGAGLYDLGGGDAGTLRPCISMSSDGSRMLVNFAVFQRSGLSWSPLGLVGFKLTGSTVPPEYEGVLHFTTSSEFLTSSAQCPILSPDGKYVARVYDTYGNLNIDGAGYSEDTYGNELAVAVAPVDSDSPWIARPRFVTAWDPTLLRVDGATMPDTRRLGVSWVSGHELLVARGTPGWDAARLERVDISTLTPHDPDGPTMVPATSTLLSTVAIPSTHSPHGDPKPLPGGGVYGDLDCGLYYGGATVTSYQSPYVVGTSTCYTDFAWNGVAPSGGSGGPGTDEPPLVVDPSEAPDPPTTPVSSDPVVVAVGEDAPGAGVSAVQPSTGALLPVSVSVAPGESVDVLIGNENGVPARYEIDPAITPPAGGGALTIIGGEIDPDSGLVVTPGPLRILADEATANATGPGELRVRVAGESDFQLIPVVVTAPPRPHAADDSLTVQTGHETTFPAEALLGNDAPSRSGAELRLIQVSGYDAGSVYIDTDDVVHLTAASDGIGSFGYAVAETGSTGYAVARVQVTSRGIAPPTVAVDTEAVHRGDPITITGSGFVPGEQVDAVMHSGEPFTIGSATAGSDGSMSFAWTIPAAAEFGSHRIVLTGALSGAAEHAVTVLSPFTVPPPATPGPVSHGSRPLVTTGTDPGGEFWGGAVLLLSGFVLVMIVVVRRRLPRRRVGGRP